MQNVTIYYIEGLNVDLGGVRVTLKSLSEVSKTSIVVLCRNVSVELKQTLTSISNVICIDCTDFRVVFQTSPYNNKILYTYLYLKNNADLLKSANIFISDLTDFYFNLDPFIVQNSKLTLTKEIKIIQNCEVNKTWLEICYDSVISNNIKRNIVLNGGFVIGTYEQVFNYYSCVVKEMQDIFYKINYPITDQCIMNKLVYNDNYQSFLSEGLVNHLSQIPEIGIIENKITHQYKVRKDLKEFLYKKYE